MQRRQRRVALEMREHLVVDHDGRSYFGPPWTTRCPAAIGSTFCVARSQVPALSRAAGTSFTWLGS